MDVALAPEEDLTQLVVLMRLALLLSGTLQVKPPLQRLSRCILQHSFMTCEARHKPEKAALGKCLS